MALGKLALTTALVVLGVLAMVVLVRGATVGTSIPPSQVSTVQDCHGPHDCGYADNGFNGDH